MGLSYPLLIKREVKMAGHWPRSFSFIAFLLLKRYLYTSSRSIKTPKKKNLANIKPS